MCCYQGRIVESDQGRIVESDQGTIVERVSECRISTPRPYTEEDDAYLPVGQAKWDVAWAGTMHRPWVQVESQKCSQLRSMGGFVLLGVLGCCEEQLCGLNVSGLGWRQCCTWLFILCGSMPFFCFPQ